MPVLLEPPRLRPDQGELTTEQWIGTLREARQLGAAQLGFSGGEPLVRRDLEELVAEARSLGYYTNLITSAIGMDAARVRRLKDAGLDHIQISFQASDAALNDYLAGTDAFAHKVEMARAVKAEGYPMVFTPCCTARTSITRRRSWPWRWTSERTTSSSPTPSSMAGRSTTGIGFFRPASSSGVRKQWRTGTGRRTGIA